MYIIRDVFHLKFGHYKEAKSLLDDAANKKLLPHTETMRLFTDFTGDAYRLIFEQGVNSLADYENFLQDSMSKDEWKQWYEKFKQHVDTGHREILKQVM